MIYRRHLHDGVPSLDLHRSFFKETIEYDKTLDIGFLLFIIRYSQH